MRLSFIALHRVHGYLIFVAWTRKPCTPCGLRDLRAKNSGSIVKGQRSGISLFSFLEFALHRQTEWSSLPCSGFCVKEGHYNNNKSLYCRFFSCSENVHGCDHYQHAYVYKQFQRQIYPLAIVGFNDVFTKRFLINNSAPHAHKISTSIA